MTEHTSAELITKLRTMGTEDRYEIGNALESAANALEAADQRAAELAAVVEKVRAWANEPEQDEWDAVERILPAIGIALTSAPADVLRERDAGKWDEGATWAAVECGAIRDGGPDFLAPGDNPYREEVE